MPQPTAKKKRNEPEPDDFEAWAKRLRKAYLKASGKAGEAQTNIRPRKQPMNAYKLAAYGYLYRLMADDMIGQLRAFVEDRDGTQWKGHGDCPTLWIARLGTRDEQTVNRRQTRSRMSHELRLAIINRVRPEVLLGFLHEAGSLDLIKQAVKRGTQFAWAEAYR